MWPFNEEKWKYMRKVTLTDGQEFVGEVWDTIFPGNAGVRIDLDDEEHVYYPYHRIQDLRAWKERG